MRILIWDKMIEKDVLTMCSVCQKIRVGDESDLWLNEEDNPELYGRYIKKFEGRISHGYCPEDYEKEMKKIGQPKLDNEE